MSARIHGDALRDRLVLQSVRRENTETLLKWLSIGGGIYKVITVDY